MESGSTTMEASGAELSRQSSRHGAAYDALVEKGIPRRMLRRAWTAVGGDAEAAMDFVRDNFDAPPSFWEPADARVEESAPPPPADRLHAALARPEVRQVLGLSEDEARELRHGHDGAERSAGRGGASPWRGGARRRRR